MTTAVTHLTDADYLIGPNYERVSVEYIGPEEAAKYLAMNIDRNRTIRPKQVEALVRDMSSGRWRFSGQSIVFDMNGQLIDGQHRLSAIIQSGEVLPFIVVRGVMTEAMNSIDTNIVRRITDRASISLGLPKNPTVSAAARIVFAVTELGRFSTSGINFAAEEEVEHLGKVGVEMNDLARKLQPYFGRGKANQFTSTPILAAAYTCSQIDAEDAETFFVEQLARGLGLAEGMPALALKNKLNALSKVPHGQTRAALMYHHSIVAWNAFRDGKRAVFPRNINSEKMPVAH